MPVSRRGTWIRIGAGAGLVAAAVMAAVFFPVADGIVGLVHWMRGAGLEGALTYIVVFAVAAVLMVPGGLLTIGAGMAYGPLWGTVLASPASVLGATLAFILGRTVLRDILARRLAADPRFGAVHAAIGRHGLRIVLLLRLSPILPYNVLNYALGASSITLRDYVLGSFVGMLPGALLYAYLGSLIGDVASLSTVDASDVRWARHALAVLGLTATLFVSVFVTRVARRALAAEIAETPSPVSPRPVSRHPVSPR